MDLTHNDDFDHADGVMENACYCAACVVAYNDFALEQNHESWLEVDSATKTIYGVDVAITGGWLPVVAPTSKGLQFFTPVDGSAVGNPWKDD